MKDANKNPGYEVFRPVKKYLRFSAYRRLLRMYKERTKEIRKSTDVSRRDVIREERNKEFIRAVIEIGRVLFPEYENDSKTLINIMELAFKNGQFALIGPLAKLIPDDAGEEAVGLKKRLLNSRSNLTVYNVPEGRKLQKQKEGTQC